MVQLLKDIDNKTKKIILVISFIYLVGLIGLLLPTSQPLFQELIPVNIFLSFLTVIFFHTKFSVNFLISFLLLLSIFFRSQIFQCSNTYRYQLVFFSLLC
jgi:hypothetical protein